MVRSKNYFNDLKSLLKFSRCDFSNIRVAAIIVTDKGIFKGVNYEDPVMNLSICAERNAIFNAITNGMKYIYEIHLISNIKNGLQMCGACRQVASNFMSSKGKIFVYTKNGKRTEYTLGKVLPYQVVDTINSNK